jgi:hypothetical protein
MDEILDGVWDWTTFHEGIGSEVHSHYHAPSGTLIDPRVPSEGLGWFDANPPERIVLTNRHHYRHSDRFVEAFGCPVLCHEAGLHEFEGTGAAVRGFAFGDELAPGVRALEVGALTPEETALHLATGPGVLAFADVVIGGGNGRLAFVPDPLIGDDPPAIRERMSAALRRLVDEESFDALLLAHGPPLPTGGREALRAFLSG